MASRQYISIIRLFNHADISASAEINVSRVKKQLAAEFGLSETGYIEADEFSYTKNEVFEELERADFPARLNYHLRLWNSKFLLHLLEKNEANIPEMETEINKFLQDPAFDEFFSPYFATSFSYVSRNLINAGNFQDLGRLLQFEEFILPAEREEAFRPLRIYLNESVRLLNNVNKDTYKKMKGSLRSWITPGGSTLLNALPPDFFEEKNDLVFHLINLTVRIQQTAKQDCRQISTELTCVTDLPEDIRSLIVNNHAAFAHKGSSSNSAGNYFWIIWVVLFLIRGLSHC